MLILEESELIALAKDQAREFIGDKEVKKVIVVAHRQFIQLGYWLMKAIPLVLVLATPFICMWLSPKRNG